MTARPIFRPMWFLRAVCRITVSLTGNTVPARSRAILYFGHSVIVIDLVEACVSKTEGPSRRVNGPGRRIAANRFQVTVYRASR